MARPPLSSRGRRCAPRGHPVTVAFDDLLAPLWPLESSGPDVDPAASGCKSPVQGLVIPDSAGEFHIDVEPADDAGQQVRVGATPESRIEVDQMDPGCTLLLPPECRGKRIPELLLGSRNSLDELDGLTTLNIHRGQQLQCFHDAQPYR